MSTWFLIGVLALSLILVSVVVRRRASDRLGAFNTRHREDASVVGLGEFVDGNRRLPVALAVNGTTLFYENDSMQAWLDLEGMREVEYDTELATGLTVVSGKVLRLRGGSQTFEFVLPPEAVSGWARALPPRPVTGPLEPEAAVMP